MEEKKLLEFLKTYAESLRTLSDSPDTIIDYLPLSCNIVMSAGGVRIDDNNGNPVAYVNSDHDKDGNCNYCPSMPLSPQSLAFSKFFVEATNLFGEYDKKMKGKE